MTRFSLPQVHRPTAVRILALRDLGTARGIGKELKSVVVSRAKLDVFTRAVGRLRDMLPELERSNPDVAAEVRRTVARSEPLIAQQRLGTR